MNITRGLLAVLSLACHAESRCSPTSYYKNCWIRRFPGIFVDLEESQRRGAQLLKRYQEESALTCSRTCCLTRNFSCNLAIFHHDASQDRVNCFHLHCPTLESCILGHRGNVVLYNITKGMDPDLLVFGKYFTSNVRALPHHYSRVNASEPLLSDKRQFIHPPPLAALPLTLAPPLKPDFTGSKELTTTPSAISTPSLQKTSQLPTVPSVTAASFITAEAEQASTAPFTSTILPALSFTTPPPTPSLYNPKPPPAQPSTSPSHHYTTTSPPTPTTLLGNTESSERYPNATKGHLGRNHTAGGEEGEGTSQGDTLEGSGPGWRVAARTLLAVVAICITALLSCCCSILLMASWRGQRKRMGSYQTAWRGQRGSMRLIKYALVRENT